MAATKLEQVLRDIEALNLDELRQVRYTVEQLVDRESAEDELLTRRAEERGIRITLPRTRMTVEEYDRFEPLPILRGESVSETVIRERR